MPMDEKLKKDIESVVATIFSEKEEAEMRKKTEEALEKAAATIEDLTNTLEEKNAEAEEQESKFSEIQAKVTDLESELEAARNETESVKEQLTEKETELEEIKKDRAADVRMAELEEAGVAHRTDEAKEAQVARIREMSDEDFAAYKEELVSIRQSVLDELAAAASEEETAEEAEEAAEGEESETSEEDNSEEEASEEETEENSEEASEEEAEEEETSEEGEDTPPANVDHGQAVFAALNMDHRPSPDLIERYAELGKAMAKEFTKSRD